MLHNGGPVPNYNQPMGYYNYPNVGHQYSTQTYSHPQNAFEGYEESKFPPTPNYTQCSVRPEGTDKVTGYPDDETRHLIPSPKCCDDKLPSAAKCKMVDFGSPEAQVDPSQQTANVSSPECPAKQTLPTFAWMINSSEDGMKTFDQYLFVQLLGLLFVFSSKMASMKWILS